MRRPAWFEAGPPSLAKRLALAPLDVLSWGYRAGAALHRFHYERGPGTPVRLPCKVVSVGNLVVGGSGKTPVAAWLAASLRARGYRVVLVSRGYGGSGREAVRVVSDGRFVRGRAEDDGDEPLWLAGQAPGVPVLVGPDRATVGRRAISAFGSDVLVLDDGFQHHRLARDLDLVVVNGAGGLGNQRVLPRGPLREGLSALARADAVGIVDGPAPEADEAAISRHAPDAFRFEVIRRPRWLRPLAGGARVEAELRGSSVGMLCGLARPASFRRTLEAAGATVVAERSFPDHHRYRPRDLAGLAGEAPVWVTTEKDAGKLLPRWAPEVDLRVLVLETRVRDDAALLDWIESRLRPRALGRDAAVPGA